MFSLLPNLAKDSTCTVAKESKATIIRWEADLILTESSSTANTLEKFATSSILHGNSKMSWSQHNLWLSKLQ